MKACKDLCPVYKVKRCCFLCPELNSCSETCPEESNELCKALIEIPDSECESMAEGILKELNSVLKQKTILEGKEKDLKEKLKVMMEQTNTKSMNKNPYFKVTYIAASSSLSFDSDLFKKSYPDLYTKFKTKPKETKAYIKCEALKKDGEKE